MLVAAMKRQREYLGRRGSTYKGENDIERFLSLRR